jgi:hypothetical protein
MLVGGNFFNITARFMFVRPRQLQTPRVLASVNQTYYGPTLLEVRSLIDGSQNTRRLELSGSHNHETGCKSMILKLWSFIKFNKVFLIAALVFDFDELSKRVFHGQLPIRKSALAY